jgi:phosphoenolpyruvate carboxykinase (GTP)
LEDKNRRLLESVLDADNLRKLLALENPRLLCFVGESIELCKPKSVFVCSDSAEDIAFIRQLALDRGEERPLTTSGHTIHFDGPNDQARDKAATRYLVAPGVDLGASLNTVDKAEGLAEVKGFLSEIMAGGLMLVRFFSLGPTNSDFSISGVQVTDSAYVGHSEDLLYRAGYEQFRRLAGSPDFFRVLHSAGRLENHVSADVDKRRIYIDLDDETVYSVNTQYAGNTVGFKKLSLRLAIRRAHRERWLAEHMFLMGVHGPDGRVTYFSGAYPSACGKTSTAMIPGETIIGDDIAYLRRKHGRVHAVNVESGIFGIIRDVNENDDPLIWKVLASPGEVIFSNVLDVNGTPRWLSDGREPPTQGVNFTGDWTADKTDADGNPVPCAHMNARYTFRLSQLENLDPRADDPEGVPVGGIIYGGRDSDTTVPVTQSFTWIHGVLMMGACLESETTAATLGKTGVRAFQPMANLDFVSILLGRYIQSHLEFAAGLSRPTTSRRTRTATTSPA